MPLDATRGASGGLDEFRLGSPREVAQLLRRLCDANTTLLLASGGGGFVSATLWSIDTEHGAIGLSVDGDDAALPGLLESPEAVAVGFLENVKIQFDLADLVLVRGTRSCTLRCRLPLEIYRFQRRGAFRVRSAVRQPMRARVRHSDIADMQLALRVLDVSIGGCALFLPDDVPPMQPGQTLNKVQIELDTDTRIGVNLRLQHVTSLNAEAGGVRLGCEFVGVDATTARALQRFIDQSQKRGRLLNLG